MAADDGRRDRLRRAACATSSPCVYADVHVDTRNPQASQAKRSGNKFRPQATGSRHDRAVTNCEPLRLASGIDAEKPSCPRAPLVLMPFRHECCRRGRANHPPPELSHDLDRVSGGSEEDKGGNAFLNGASRICRAFPSPMRQWCTPERQKMLRPKYEPIEYGRAAAKTVSRPDMRRDGDVISPKPSIIERTRVRSAGIPPQVRRTSGIAAIEARFARFFRDSRWLTCC